MPATPNIRSFCVFPQSGKCEPSRANKNSKSKRQLATCPQRPIYGVFVFFRKAENVSRREQTKTQRASDSLRHARNAQTAVRFREATFPAEGRTWARYRVSLNSFVPGGLDPAWWLSKTWHPSRRSAQSRFPVPGCSSAVSVAVACESDMSHKPLPITTTVIFLVARCGCP